VCNRQALLAEARGKAHVRAVLLARKSAKGTEE
jgi:hypothetical protein